MTKGAIVLFIDDGIADGPDPLGKELPATLSHDGGFMKTKDVVIGSKVYTYIGTDLASVIVVAKMENYYGKTVFQVKREGSDTILPKTRTAAALRLKDEKLF